MHELAIAQAIAEGVAARAIACGATRVTSVRVRIGAAAGIMPEALSGCFEMVAQEEPPLCGARLLIDVVPHRARCRSCQDVAFPVVDFVAQCPACQGWNTDVVSGTELEVREMEIVTARDT